MAGHSTEAEDESTASSSSNEGKRGEDGGEAQLPPPQASSRSFRGFVTRAGDAWALGLC